MPVCAKCSHMDATVNLRRRKPPYTGEWMCKDKEPCNRRRKAAKAAEREAIAKR